jgi:DNA primase
VKYETILRRFDGQFRGKFWYRCCPYHKERTPSFWIHAETGTMRCHGCKREGDLLDLAAGMNIIEKSGTWYAYKDERIGQGRENARNYLREHPEMLKTIRQEVLAKAGIGPKNAAPATGANAPAGATAAQEPGRVKFAGATTTAAPAKTAPATAANTAAAKK